MECTPVAFWINISVLSLKYSQYKMYFYSQGFQEMNDKP